MIVDFEIPFPYSNSYSYQSSVFSHKQNNSDVFVASGLMVIKTNNVDKEIIGLTEGVMGIVKRESNS